MQNIKNKSKIRILLAGLGRMGELFYHLLKETDEIESIKVYDIDKSKLKLIEPKDTITKLSDIEKFNPNIIINASPLKYSIQAYEMLLPYTSDKIVLVDIASVKVYLKNFYLENNFSFISIHPMFGPTFADKNNLKNENIIFIKESNSEYIDFFLDFFSNMGLNIFHFSFTEHDKTIAYSLSIPFVASLLFASSIEKHDAPGTTFKKHDNIAKGVLNEDPYLISEILFNPETKEKLQSMDKDLNKILTIIENDDYNSMIELVKSLKLKF